MLYIIGSSAACARVGANDLTSYENMEESGWNLNNIDKEARLVLQDETCEKKLDFIHKYNWIAQRWRAQSISTTFWGHGRASLQFGNCNNAGQVSVFLDGTEIGRSRSDEEATTANFNVKEGSVLTIKADNLAIIKLFELKLKCGTGGTTT